MQKWMLQTVRAEKVDAKNGVICLGQKLPIWIAHYTFLESNYTFLESRAKKGISPWTIKHGYLNGYSVEFWFLLWQNSTQQEA